MTLEIKSFFSESFNSLNSSAIALISLDLDLEMASSTSKSASSNSLIFLFSFSNENLFKKEFSPMELVVNKKNVN